MFARIFKNSFIINSSISNLIRLNYVIDNRLEKTNSDKEIMDEMMKHESTCKSGQIVFFKIQDELFNPVLSKFCFIMGLSYDVYDIIIEQNHFYNLACVLPYDPSYRERNFVKLHPRFWSMSKQSIPFNYGILPFEYWINHYGCDPYATQIYDHMLEQYKKEEKMSQSDHPELDSLTMDEFIRDPKYNGGFNTEFSIPLFNKRLMLYLMKTKYILFGINTNIKQEELSQLTKGGKTYDD